MFLIINWKICLYQTVGGKIEFFQLLFSQNVLH